ncbi:MAG: hypothetical protein A3A72_03090 [Deltaproteobacteria bacterium RIFCSPLOWO2_01_FULL_38_9]|nr:MAG: hypothetical protein A3A72_03090 [Deltaproteobacteria bacterium RIFCSPLOWO2_01_FULL_38_9]
MVVKRFFLPVMFFFFFSPLLYSQEQRQPEQLKELFIRLLLSDQFEQGKEPPLTLNQKIEKVANSSLWRNRIFTEDPRGVQISAVVNGRWVEEASHLTERFLVDRLFSLLGEDKTAWPVDFNERKTYFQKQLGMILSDEEVKRIELFSKSLLSSDKEFSRSVKVPLDIWKVNLLWVSRETTWIKKSYSSQLDIEALKGEMEVLEWGEALPKSPEEHVSHRMGFGRAFSLVRHPDGSLSVIYTPVIRSMIAYQEPEYAEIVEANTRTQLRSYRDRMMGPYIAHFNASVGARSRYITIRFLNRQNDLIDRLSVSIDLQEGKLITFEGNQNGNVYLAHQIIRRQLLNRESPLAKCMLEARPELNHILWDERAPFLERELTILEDGSFKLVLQRMQEGRWVEESALEFIFDKEKASEILKGPLRSLLREMRP